MNMVYLSVDEYGISLHLLFDFFHQIETFLGLERSFFLEQRTVISATFYSQQVTSKRQMSEHTQEGERRMIKMS